MADAIGISGIHNVSGRCDLCGRGVDAVTEELNALDCTYQDCPPLVYHQDCLEKYLKSIRLEKNRKTGFKCPRGSGKGTSFKEACPGKIDKSHPIHPRNDFGKKRRKAKPPPEPLPRQKPLPKKEKEKGKEKDKEPKGDKGKEKAKPKSGVVIKALNVSNVSLVKNVKPTVGRSVSLSGDMLKVQSESRKSMSSTSSAYSSTASASGLDSQDGLRTGSMPLFSAWSKPMSTAAQSQVRGENGNSGLREKVPDMNSMTAFPPALIGSTSEDTKNISRTSQNCWANASRVQPGAHARSMSVNDAALQGIVLQSQSLPNSSSLSVGNTGELPVGMDYADGMGVEGKLTKAQKKNMKRAEKKKKNMTPETPASSSPTSSSTAPASASATPVSQTPGTQTPIELSEDGSSPLFSSQDNSTNSVLSELCVDTLVAWKTMYHIQQLQKLGFEPWQSAAAIWRYGGNLERAIAWLLDYNGENDDELQSALDVVPEVDVSSELSYLQEVQETFSLPECILEQAVVDCNGDLDVAIPAVLGSREDVGGELKGTSSRPLSPDIQVEASPFAGGFPAGQVPGVETNGNHMEGPPNSEVLTPSLDSLTKSVETVVEPNWSASLSEQFMLGGVLGSTLEEYKSGNMDFTALASKGFGAGLRPVAPPDANVLGLQGMRANTSPTSRLDLLTPGQAAYRNLSPGGVRSVGGIGNVITDVGHYNRILSRDNSAPLGSSGFGVSAGGLTSSWNLGGGTPYSFSNAPQLGAESGQEDQQDWRHFIGNLLEG